MYNYIIFSAANSIVVDGVVSRGDNWVVAQLSQESADCFEMWCVRLNRYAIQRHLRLLKQSVISCEHFVLTLEGAEKIEEMNNLCDRLEFVEILEEIL